MLNKVAYINYRHKAVMIQNLGRITWSALSTFVIVGKNGIGIDNIPIFETMAFVASLLGIYYVFKYKVSIKRIIYVDIVAESLFLIALYIAILNNYGFATYGFLIYMIILLNAYVHELLDESMRSYEDKYMKTHSATEALKLIRKINKTTTIISAGIGVLISMLFITYFKVDLVTFAKYILILNILQNIAEYYITYKYLR